MRCVAKDSNGNILSDAVSEKFCEADRKPIESVPCELSCNLGQWHAIVIQEVREVSSGCWYLTLSHPYCLFSLLSDQRCPVHPLSPVIPTVQRNLWY